jgi:hypothetical protein
MPTSAGEEATRKWFENRFKKPFPKARPSFLKYKRKANLELDGFNEELKLAFEYNGKQHYATNAYFKMDAEKLNYLVGSDGWKHKKCIEKGIFLVVVPNVAVDEVGPWLDNYFDSLPSKSTQGCFIAQHCSIL